MGVLGRSSKGLVCFAFLDLSDTERASRLHIDQGSENFSPLVFLHSWTGLLRAQTFASLDLLEILYHFLFVLAREGRRDAAKHALHQIQINCIQQQYSFVIGSLESSGGSTVMNCGRDMLLSPRGCIM